MIDPHANTRTLAYGAPMEQAKAAMILLHGRGASPEDILGLGAEVDPGGVIFLAPAAANFVWYPETFLNPQAANQPYLRSALHRVGDLFDQLGDASIPPERVILAGFSQGACLSLEYAARHARRYGGVAALSGGLIGAEADLQGYAGSLADTPVFLGCSDVDPYIPAERVRESGRIIQTLGGATDVRIYPGMGHTLNADELEAVRQMLASVLSDRD